MKTYPWMVFLAGAITILLTAGTMPLTSGDLPPAVFGLEEQTVRTPAYLARGEIPDEEYHWLYIPTNPNELATNQYYSFLSGQLITSGVVDASQCPLGGVWPNGYANACGLQKTQEASLYLQNVYDDEILAASSATGVPPIMIKQLMRQESQFWPARMGLYHFGLGHLTEIGASTALQWSPELFQSMCVSVLGSACQESYVRQPPDIKANLDNRLLSLLDATCPTCDYKIDIPKAERSVRYIAEALMGYCRQTSQIVRNATDKRAEEIMDYTAIWKLTLLNYNIGPTCVYDAVRESYKDILSTPDDMLTWDFIVKYMDEGACSRGIMYVDNITAEFYDFTPPNTP